MNRERVFDALEHGLEATRQVLDEGDDGAEVLVDDLRGLIAALYLTLRRYRSVAAHASDRRR